MRVCEEVPSALELRTVCMDGGSVNSIEHIY